MISYRYPRPVLNIEPPSLNVQENYPSFFTMMLRSESAVVEATLHQSENKKPWRRRDMISECAEDHKLRMTMRLLSDVNHINQWIDWQSKNQDVLKVMFYRGWCACKKVADRPLSDVSVCGSGGRCKKNAQVHHNKISRLEISFEAYTILMIFNFPTLLRDKVREFWTAVCQLFFSQLVCLY